MTLPQINRAFIAYLRRHDLKHMQFSSYTAWLVNCHLSEDSKDVSAEDIYQPKTEKYGDGSIFEEDKGDRHKAMAEQTEPKSGEEVADRLEALDDAMGTGLADPGEEPEDDSGEESDDDVENDETEEHNNEQQGED